MAYFTSQLLTLQASGARVLLRNVDSRLLRALRVLHLDKVFQIDQEDSTADQRSVAWSNELLPYGAAAQA
ncbi:hypothetical protein [Hymenobacter cellulosilyticus]|uniref:Uncharacterized protein n=1 Tax=Hymenobacter cellulosilyticus TaxID=2932248 RepID=A0A8T9Q740_9BACT|nr:hypothetical protein [Hymenobacter cellulosilyticus]UOQ71309.1 hypothetical protein MUN79_22155 [Hymenobacter cellulosilyticus]